MTTDVSAAGPGDQDPVALLDGVPLTEDEAYYRLWSARLQMGYFDHPPMIAWWIAAIKAQEAAETYGWGEARTVGSAVASDAFFPFADGLLTAAEAGATAVIQPGGSMRDDEVIAAADEAGLAMVFTGMRHFRH